MCKTTQATSDEVPRQTKKVGVAASLARPNILALEAYTFARNVHSSTVLLDFNENATGPMGLPSNSNPNSNSNPECNNLALERYPCPFNTSLKEMYASYRGGNMKAKNVFIGSGSDEAIDLLMRIFCTPGDDAIMTTPPTYGMYDFFTTVNNVGHVEVPLMKETFDLNIPEMLEAVTDNVKLMFVCSPGNPTSKAIPLDDIITLAESSYKGLIVVDEAYIDFSKEESAVSLIETYPNIVVLQTMSKSFGLAGIRCGFAIGSDDVIQLMSNIKEPMHHVNALAADVATNAMKNIKAFEDNIQSTLNRRQSVAKKLEQLDFVVKVFPSDSNFLLVRLKQLSKEVFNKMAENGVAIRYRGDDVHCEECLRITIGTEEENRVCLDMLAKTYYDLSSAAGAENN